MNPVAFNENNTLFLNIETGVVLVLLIAILIVGTIHNIIIHNPEKSFVQLSTILQTVLSLLAVLSFTVFINYIDNHKSKTEQLMIQQIESAYSVENLRTIEELSIYCDSTYNGSIDSVIWIEKNESKELGLLIGQKKGDQCRFILEETVNKNILQELDES